MNNDRILKMIAVRARESLEYRVKSFTEIAERAEARAAKLTAEAERILAKAKTESEFAAQNRAAAERARVALVTL